MFGRKNRIEIKEPAQIRADAGGRAGRRRHPAAARGSPSSPGVTTPDLDAIARESITARWRRRRRSSATTASRPSICTSVNDEIVHGIPGPRVINDGDVVSIDCGAIVDGWHGDAAFSMVVGTAPPRCASC